MSVMVLDEKDFASLRMFLCMKEVEEYKGKISNETVNAWGKILSEKYDNMVNYFYQMNVLNYCQRYNEKMFFMPIDFSELTAPYPTEAQAVKIMSSLRYNTCDYFATPELDALIDKYSVEKRNSKPSERLAMLDGVRLTDTDKFLVSEKTIEKYLLKTGVRPDIVGDDGIIDSTVICDFAVDAGMTNIGDLGYGYIFVGDRRNIAENDGEFFEHIRDIEYGRA